MIPDHWREKQNETMNMKWILPACMALTAHSAQARLGETVEECEARYGKPTAEARELSFVGLKGVWRREYEFEGFEITISFVNDRSAYELFLKKTRNKSGKFKITAGERDVILLRSLGEKYEVAKEPDDAEGIVRWRGKNGNQGIFSNDVILSVFTAEYFALEAAAEKKRAEARKLRK